MCLSALIRLIYWRMRKTKYDCFMEERGAEYLRRMAEDGYSDKEIARDSGISDATFKRWKATHKEFYDALKLGRAGADYAVIDALYKKACGYSVKVNKTYKLKRVDYDPDTGKKLREYEELCVGEDENYIPADVRATSFWLKNRQPDRWSDKPDGTSAEAVCEVEIPDADMIGDYEDAE